MTDATPAPIPFADCEYCTVGSPIFTPLPCCHARALAEAPTREMQTAMADKYRAAMAPELAEAVLERARQRIRARKASDA